MSNLPPEPAVASLSKSYVTAKPTLTAGHLVEAFAGALAEVAALVRQEGALVGHIKAWVEMTPGGEVRLSVVKDEPRRQSENFSPEARPSSVNLALTAIVYGPSPAELSCHLATALSKHWPADLAEAAPPNLLPPNPVR